MIMIIMMMTTMIMTIMTTITTTMLVSLTSLWSIELDDELIQAAENRHFVLALDTGHKSVKERNIGGSHMIIHKNKCLFAGTGIQKHRPE